MWLRGTSNRTFYIGRAPRPRREEAREALVEMLDTEGGLRRLRTVLAEELPVGRADTLDEGQVIERLAAGVAEGRYVLIGFRPRPVWAPPFEEGGAGAEETEDEQTIPEEKKWFEIELHDDSNPPVPMGGARYRVELPDGQVIEGELDDQGKARIEVEEPSRCKVTFPDFDDKEWEKK